MATNFVQIRKDLWW